ncbi:hypothetical protein A9Q99_06755 [Gammaproteobacteria bacterium 45_16_T64]|nr:hypothetical protein A9Q99_06755 [Gammaproteobacteria bacterium 45_16_T64]
MNDSHKYLLRELILPSWVSDIVVIGQIVESEKERMRIAIALAARQVEEGTGGPFGAVVCELETGVVIGIGVNQVTATNWSSAHAEFVAWTMAQQQRGSYDLAEPPVGLYSSAQPCVSCWGGLFWTGINRLVYGATKGDVESLAGFDEGPVPQDWKSALEVKGVSVEGGVLREFAQEALRRYRELDGEAYNAS